MVAVSEPGRQRRRPAEGTANEFHQVAPSCHIGNDRTHGRRWTLVRHTDRRVSGVSGNGGPLPGGAPDGAICVLPERSVKWYN